MMTETIHPQKWKVNMGYFIINTTGTKSITGVGFRPTLLEFKITPPVDAINVDKASSVNTDTPDCYAGTSFGFAKNDGTNVGTHSGGSADSINASSMYSSNTYSIIVRFADSNGGSIGYVKAYVSSFNSNGFTITVDQVDRNTLVIYTAYRC